MRVYLGTYGTEHTFSQILSAVDLYVWEYPPLPLLRYLRDVGAQGFGQMYYEWYSELRRQANHILVPVWHASHVPICSEYRCVTATTDEGDNKLVAQATNYVPADVRNILTVNFHMPKSQVGIRRTGDAMAVLLRSGRALIFTFEPQYTPHAMDIDETYQSIEYAVNTYGIRGNPIPLIALQLENEFIRDFWNQFKMYGSIAELEENVNIVNYWYKKLEKLYNYNKQLISKVNATGIKHIPMFLRYAKVEPYLTPTGGMTWKKRVRLTDNCKWCGPHFKYIADAMVKFAKNYPDANMFLVYTGTKYSHRIPEEEAIRWRIEDLEILRKYLAEVGLI